MPFYADLHIHSKHSRATSKNCDLEHLAWWARRKGITVVATGDFTHPVWFDELRGKLLPAEPGLFRLRPEVEREVERNLPPACRAPTRFLLEVEISTIYKKGERTRKVHHLLYAASFDTAARIRERLGRIGNLASDGRPILGLDSRDLLEITLESGDDAYLVPAHIWTPWFSTLGSKSGFDSVEECYGDLAREIFAVETGLSSDPPMNWRVSGLDRFTLVSNSDAHSPPMLGREACVFDCEMDYFAMRRALETGSGFGGTVEFFPEEGKYHLDGHRACGVRLAPGETRERDGRCPACGKPVTVGVMHRVEVLADRPDGSRPQETAPYRCLVPLPEIVGEIRSVGPKSKTVERAVSGLVSQLGPELEILERLPLEEVARAGDPLVTEALTRLRDGRVRREAGYDGEYGTIRLFEEGEIEARKVVAPLFRRSGGSPAQAPRRQGAGAGPSPGPAQGPTRGAERQAGLGGQAGAGDDAETAGGTATRMRASGETGRPGRELDQPAAPAATQLALLMGSVLDGLDPDQQAAARCVLGPLLIVAGPGTGKTRTLTYRLAHLTAEVGVAPERCLAVTFTRRAAREMRERLEALVPRLARRVPVATFHGLGLTILREQAAALGLPGDFQVAGEEARSALGAELFGLSPGRARSLLEEIGRRRRERVLGEVPSPDADPELDRRTAIYEAALAERALVDFDDLLLRPVELFSRRPEVLAAYRQRFRYISIDEYQDVDALGYRLVGQLAPAPEAHLCAIGDPDQAIYGFRGADVSFFLRFQEDYPGAEVVHLARNYRSSPTIVGAALEAIRPQSLVPDRRLEAVGAAAAERVVLRSAASVAAEAEGVVQGIEELLGGTSYFSLDSGRVGDGDGRHLSFGDFAVLYRTRAQAAPLAEALGRSGIPFQERSHEGLQGRPAVAALVRALRAGADGIEGGAPASVEARLRQAAAMLATEERPASGSQDDARGRPVRDAGDTDGPAPESGEADDGRPAGAAELLAAAEMLAPLAAGSGDDLAAFLDEIALGADVDTWDPRAERVSLLTLHAAKGLEFPVVFLVGCEEGLLPLSWPGSETDIAEERRLFFVGVTRARSLLYLSHGEKRRLRGETRPTGPSRFLRDIRDALLERRQAQPSSPRRGKDQLQLF